MTPMRVQIRDASLAVTPNQTWLRDQLAALAKARSAHVALRRGSREQLGVTTDTLVVKMSSAGDTVFVALNRGDSPQAATGLPSGDYTNLIDGTTKSGSV